MRTHDMINSAEKNGKTYISRYGSYSKENGFELKFNPHPASFQAFINNLFHEDCWTEKIEKKKMSKSEIEKILGYEIEIDGYEPIVKLTQLEQEAVDHLLVKFADFFRD